MATNNKKSKIEVSEWLKIYYEIKSLIEKYGNKFIDFSKNQINKIKLKFHGKTIAIIGPKAAGKSTFIKILQDSNYDIDVMIYTPTQQAIPMDSFKVEWKMPILDGNKSESISFKFRKPKDVGGELAYRDNGDWLSVCQDVDYLFYIFDSNEYLKETKMVNRVESDFIWIAENNQIFGQGFRIIVFANKIDLLKDEEKSKWEKTIIPEIEEKLKNILGVYNKHLCFITPICLASKSTRANAIGLSLQKVSELT